MFKINNKNLRTTSVTSSSAEHIEHISHLFLVLTLNKYGFDFE